MVRYGVAVGACALREAFQVLEVRVQRMRLPALCARRARTRSGRHEADDARSKTGLGLEAEERLDPREVRVRLLELDELGLERDLGELRDGELVGEELLDGRGALEGAELPGEREHVPPEDVLDQERDRAGGVVRLYALVELLQP